MSAPSGSAAPDLRIGSLCTGYGGLDGAVQQVLGGELAWVADPDPGARTVLAHHHPDVPNLGDITATDFGQVEPVDVVCAGFPCQDLSYAGQGAGIAEGTRSGLWYVIADALDVLRPGLVVLENVRAIVTRRPGLDVVLADLARLGFDAQWMCSPASAIGAPHHRWRWFLVAHPPHQRHQRDRDAWGRRPGPAHGGVAAPHPAGTRRGKRSTGGGLQPGEPGPSGDPAAHPTSPRWETGREGLPRASTAADAARDGRHEGRPEPAWIVGGPHAPLGRDAAPNTRRGRLGQHSTGSPSEEAGPVTGDKPASDRGLQLALDWGPYAPAIDRWARALGRPAPDPTEPAPRGGQRLSPRFVEWLMGLPAGHVTAVPGLSRNQQLRLLGNGVVIQQGAAALRLLLDRTEAA